MIAIVDYGAGNLKSVKKAFDYLGAGVVVTTQPEIVATADKIVLPGVGHIVQNAAPELVAREIDTIIGKIARSTAAAAN